MKKYVFVPRSWCATKEKEMVEPTEGRVAKSIERTNCNTRQHFPKLIQKPEKKKCNNIKIHTKNNINSNINSNINMIIQKHEASELQSIPLRIEITHIIYTYSYRYSPVLRSRSMLHIDNRPQIFVSLAICINTSNYLVLFSGHLRLQHVNFWGYSSPTTQTTNDVQ